MQTDAAPDARQQAPTATGNPPAPPALLLTAAELARELSIGMRTLRTRDSAGLLPAPIRMGRSVRWSRAEIVEWIAAGAPDRATWNRLKAAKGGRK